MSTCEAVMPNPSTHGDTHTHVCSLDANHVDPGPGGGVPVDAHECGCGVKWVHDLRSDGASATLIRFPSDRVPQVDMRQARGAPPIRCLICNEPTAGRPTHDYGQASYHTECRPMFLTALQSAENILEALRAAETPTFQRAYLIRIIAVMSRAES